MASKILRACKAFTSYVNSSNVTNNVTAIGLLKPQVPLVQNVRNTNFFQKKSASHLWKSVTNVSNAGKRRGRGKGVTKIRDLNRGQKLGCGKVPIIFPGLNAPIVKGDYILRQRHLSEEEQQNAYTVPTPEILTKKRFKIHPLKRGWTGGLPGGRKIGPPDPINDDTFEGFETWILKAKFLSVITSTLGRTKCFRSMVVTGNRNGLAGFSEILGKDFKSTINTAKNKAGQRLIYIERYNDHTVLHDFYTQFGKTKIFVKQKHKGYGLKCHRVIRACCEAIGITDLYAKVEGSKNTAYIVKAFFIGLLQQKTHQEMANEKQLHLVEMRKENNYFPMVLASPPKTRSVTEIPSNEYLDFSQYVMNGKVPLEKPKLQPFYTKLPSWLIHLRKQERRRGQDKVILRLRAEYDDICSFLAEKYPEARAFKGKKDDNTQNETDEV